MHILYIRIMSKKKVVVLTGAGVSAESGISTFRDAGGLWEGHDIMEVASPQGWQKNKELVLDFYNRRRAQLPSVTPNAAHEALVRLEEKYDVTIVTQNVDDLHERAGSSHIVHIHGELTKVRSSFDDSLVYDWEYKPLNIGDKCTKGSQLRPHIVWFGESVPLYGNAAQITTGADILLVIGTSLVVYPAAGLIDMVRPEVPIYIINPNMPETRERPFMIKITEMASVGVPKLVNELLQNA